MNNSIEKISIIIPFFNEEENIDFVFSEIITVMKQLNYQYELIVVNDGSTDKTLALIDSYKSLPITLINNKIRQGQGAAFFQGFHKSSGDLIITLDGDGQNDFKDILKMLKFIPEFDAVFGERVTRYDPVTKKITSKLGNFIRKIILKDPINDTSCSLKIFKKEITKKLIPIKGSFRFFPFQTQLMGYTFISVPVNHRVRKKGFSKYSVLKFYFIPVIFDLLFFLWLKLNIINKSLLKKNNH